MRVLVFAHVPPPFHGQSYMVQQMLEHLGRPGDELVLYHVNAQLSEGVSDIGAVRLGKFFRLAVYIAQAWWLRGRHSIDAFYYVPAPAKRVALYRDWLVLLLAGSLFKIRIFHWHATGLGQWVIEGSTAGWWRRLEASITRKILSRHDLSCVLNEWGRHDVEVFAPPRVAVVPNGIPDPCPDFDSTVLPERQGRLKHRSAATAEQPALFHLLYLAHATRTKGLFDAIDAVALANARLEKNRGMFRFCLTVAGATVSRDEEETLRHRMTRDDLKLDPTLASDDRAAIYAGFVNSRDKDRLLRQTDALCFPSFFPNEGQPVSVIEALAYGLPVVLSRWRALPEMIPMGLGHLVDPCDAPALSEILLLLPGETRFAEYRSYYLKNYTSAAHCASLQAALLSVKSQGT